MSQKQTASLVKAATNLSRLQEWKSKMDLSQVPCNQFGRVARLTICKIVGIPRSTIGSNEQIRMLFEAWDEEIEETRKRALGESDVQPTRKSFTRELQDKCNALRTALDAQSAVIRRLEYLEDTGLPMRSPFT